MRMNQTKQHEFYNFPPMPSLLSSFLQAYCETLSQLSLAGKPSRMAHFRSRSENTALPVFNYSTQTKNSAQQALASIRDMMGPKKRYTFCQEYLFSTFDPADLEKKGKEQQM